MFIQVIDGRVSDPSRVRDSFERWLQELRPGAIGWLGTTAGVTDDGRFIALARFESEEAARRNSDRPEQDRWWAEASQLFTGDVTFRDSSDVILDIHGDPDTAGFVQVMRGVSSDAARSQELMTSHAGEWAAFRPDVIAGVTVGHDGGAFTVANYFTSEAEAREGERKEPPAELTADMAEMQDLMVGEVEYFDLTQPWLYSPAK